MIPWLRALYGHRKGRHALSFLLIIGSVCLLVPPFLPGGPDDGSLAATLLRPSLQNPLGSDELGRDVLTRLLWGGRISLSIALLVTMIAPTIGTAYGFLAASMQGVTGDMLMRLVDGLLAIPRLPMYLVLLTLVGPSYGAVVIVMAAFEWPMFARLAFLGALGVSRASHVEAARALGAGHLRVAIRHIGPETAGPLLVAVAVGVRGRIVAESSLSYLGFGIAPPTPSWGNMLAAAQSRVWDYPALAVYPGLAILVVSVAATLLGDALRDLNDPASVRR